MSQLTNRERNQWARELNDVVRGASGGFLFGIPLLYTMEVWWIGVFVDPPRMFVALVLTFGIVFLLNHTTGFRKAEDIRLSAVVVDTTQALGISVICTTGILLLLRRITLATPTEEALGKIVYETAPFALGVALANQFLTGERGQNNTQQGEKRHNSKGKLNATLKDVAATAIGTMFIGFTIAPTQEVAMLAADITPPFLLALMAA